MLLSYVAAFLARRRSFVWRPAVAFDNPTVVSTLMADLAR